MEESLRIGDPHGIHTRSHALYWHTLEYRVPFGHSECLRWNTSNAPPVATHWVQHRRRDCPNSMFTPTMRCAPCKYTGMPANASHSPPSMSIFKYSGTASGARISSNRSAGSISDDGSSLYPTCFLCAPPPLIITRPRHANSARRIGERGGVQRHVVHAILEQGSLQSHRVLWDRLECVHPEPCGGCCQRVEPDVASNVEQDGSRMCAHDSYHLGHEPSFPHAVSDDAGADKAVDCILIYAHAPFQIDNLRRRPNAASAQQ